MTDEKNLLVSKRTIVAGIATWPIAVLIVSLGFYWFADWSDARWHHPDAGLMDILLLFVVTLPAKILGVVGAIYLIAYDAVFNIPMTTERREPNQALNHMMFWGLVIVCLRISAGWHLVKAGLTSAVEMLGYAYTYLTDRKRYYEERAHPEDIERTQLVADLKEELAERERLLAMLKARRSDRSDAKNGE